MAATGFALIAHERSEGAIMTVLQLPAWGIEPWSVVPLKPRAKNSSLELLDLKSTASYRAKTVNTSHRRGLVVLGFVSSTSVACARRNQLAGIRQAWKIRWIDMPLVEA